MRGISGKLVMLAMLTGRNTVITCEARSAGVHIMKASEFKVVEEARRAAEGQLSFFNRMMAIKTAGSSEKKTTPGVATNRMSGFKKK